MLREAQNFNNVINNPWRLFPALFVIVAILAFNFVGDGLRDATDPFNPGHLTFGRRPARP